MSRGRPQGGRGNVPGKSPGALVRLIGGASFIFACRLAGAGLTFASQVLMARWMGAEQFGLYVIAFSWCILLATVATGGMAQGGMRFIGVGLARSDFDYVRGYVRRGYQLSVAGGLIVAAVGAAVVLFGLVPEAHRVPLLVMLATVPFFTVLNYYGGITNALSWIAQSFLPINVIRPLVFLLALWVLALRKEHYGATEALVLQWFAFAGVAVTAGLAFQYRLGREVQASGRTYETRRWVRTALPLLGASIFSGYLPEITVVVAGFWLPSAEIGVFQVSYRIALLISFGLYAVDAFTAPEAARFIARAEQGSLQATVDRATRLRFWPSLAAVLVLAVAGRPILGIFGPEFVSGYAVLLILAVAQLFIAAVGPVTRLMMLGGHHDRALLAALGALVLLVALLAALAPRFGSVGAAVAALIDIAVWSAWMRYLVVKSLNVRPSIF